MNNPSPNAQLVPAIFDEVAKGNGGPFLDACHEDMVWRIIGNGAWSGEFVGKQAVINELLRPLNRVLVERATVPTRVIDGGEFIVVQARGKNVTHDGQRYDNDYAFVIQFKDGKIIKYEEYCDTELVARVLPDRAAAKTCGDHHRRRMELRRLRLLRSLLRRNRSGLSCPVDLSHLERLAANANASLEHLPPRRRHHPVVERGLSDTGSGVVRREVHTCL